EPLLFLRFATALKILLGWSINDRAITRALTLLSDYLLQYRELYDEKAMKPNHHWVVHLPDQVRDYGAIYNYWLFLVERLNKTLKDYNTNHRGGGELEVTLMHTFQRESRVRALVSHHLHNYLLHAAECALGERLLLKPGEDRGTVEAAAVETLSPLRLELGPKVSHVLQPLSRSAISALCDYYNLQGLRVHMPLERQPLRGTRPVAPSALFFDYMVLDGRRVIPTSRTHRKNAGSSIVKVIIGGQMYGGEVHRIFQHFQRDIREDIIWAEMRWMKPVKKIPTKKNVWLAFPELEIQFWTYGQYHEANDASAPPPIVPFSSIWCQLSRGEYRTTKQEFWITTTMERVCMRACQCHLWF
ncbi:hypothetical protein NEOLEDRAFT_1081026, partial [Neolentinus lepideus HHB14362 ss-1]